MIITDVKSGNQLSYDPDQDIFFHVLIHQPCEDIDQCFAGWSEQTIEDNQGWDRIREAVRNNQGDIWEWMDQDSNFDIE